ncbi:predicted protein [Naegleria gruberi]|uniref:Predicted protein n=1 Tax=Naegleria gruberi TaxID=5762 RepID=D2W5M3_NAEGR|nr:uncharacterized protein NAEGRDRAFT_54823 [Naegleria gruberi]EFC35630.1 predicted protein [Naegleria gruberi]|eukprot:XP_002668374.1 predicted protein [Naegleria gruberi strain NEG-M]
MYSTKSEKERPLIVRSVNAGMEVSDVSDSADDFTEFNNGVAIERINSTKSTPTVQTQENTHSKESELLQDENDETPSNEQLKRKRDELIGNQSQDNGIEDNDNDWVDVNDEEEAYDKLLEEREVEKNGERHEAGVESSSKKPRNNDFYLTKEMIKDSYAKLESKMSDVNYGSFTQISKCGTVCKSTLSKANSILNIKTIEDFDIRVSLEENMVLVNILHMVKETIRYHVRWVKLIKADKHLSDYILKEDLDLLKKKFIYLLNLDGADGLVTFALQLINSKAFGNPKSRENVFPIAGWRGGEEKLRSISDGIKFMIETMREQGVEVDGVVYQVDFWVTTDLLSLMKISRLLFKQMCPYCMTLSTICDRRHQLRLATELGCILSIPPSKVIICLLHMKERVVERLLIDSIMLLSSNRKVISILKKMEHMERFTLRELKTKKGVMYRCYLTGNMVKSVFKNLKCLRGHICGSQYTLLILFRSISNLLDISQPLNENQQERLSILLGKMEKLYCTVYTTKPKSWYLHILFHHVPDLLKFYKTIKPYETQGFESAHIDDKEFMSHTSHNGGKESYLDRMFPGFKDQMLIQFLIPRLKKLMLCNYFDMKFHFVERRTQSYINFLKQPYPPCSLVSSEELIHSNPESTPCNNNCNNHIAITVLSQYNPSGNNSTGNIISYNNEAATQAFDMAINIMEDIAFNKKFHAEEGEIQYRNLQFDCPNAEQNPNQTTQELIELLNDLQEQVRNAYEERCEVRFANLAATKILKKCNQLFDEVKPWILVKDAVANAQQIEIIII